MDDDYGSEITNQDDAWPVVRAFFQEMKLVGQQLDSFDRFIETMMPSIVEEANYMEMVMEQQYSGRENESKRKIEIFFSKVAISLPSHTESDGTTVKKFYPNAARLRNQTYESEVCVEVRKIEYEGGELKSDETKLVKLGTMPIMLRSKYCILSNLSENELADAGECQHDQGGYFIISGSEKVIIAQERIAHNNVYVYAKSQPSKYSFVAEVKSSIEGGTHPTSTFHVRMLARSSTKRHERNARTIEATLPYIRKPIPIVIIFRALGIVTDCEILQYVCYDFDDQEMLELLRPCIEEASPVQNEDVALDMIGKRGPEPGVSKEKRIKYASDILQKELLPHVGITPNCRKKKAFFLGYMVHRLLMVALGRKAPDDRDHYGKKRVDLVGPLLSFLFKGVFKSMKNDMKRAIRKEIESNRPIDLSKVVNNRMISRGMQYSLATGNWIHDPKKFMEARAGVSQVLNRLTYASTLSHLRRLNTPTPREGKLAKPRQLHNTTWGLLCPAETPEGQACGLVKNMALMAYITHGKSPNGANSLIEFMETCGLEKLEEISLSSIKSATKVFFNGNWVGIHNEPEELVSSLKGIRRSDSEDHYTEVAIARDYRYREIRIQNDSGRVCRPLFVVEKESGKPRLRIKRHHIEELKQVRVEPELDVSIKCWKDLLAYGLVEYIDVDEEEACMIAMIPEELAYRPADQTDNIPYTHCEVHTSMILGVCASLIPFPHHNQSPRNTYQSAMGKQAMGVYASNFSLRMDTTAHVLYYPQKPICITKALEFMSFRDLPAGQNAVVAIACYSGYNQEDSIMMNQSSIDRGLFRSVYFRSYREEEKQQDNETIEKPRADECRGTKTSSYANLDDDGLVPPGTKIAGGDVIIGKTVKLKAVADPLNQAAAKYTKKDVSTSLRSNESGIIDQVIVSTNPKEGTRFVKTRVRNVRIPQIGDKFASRHGQKGTCGMTYRQEDMPFTSEGIPPDLIVNPHAIPSRMTIGHLIECLLSKVSAIKGMEGDATAFSTVTVDEISDMLWQHGFQKRGFEVMYNGHTGRKLNSQIFFGPTYYQRLKHMVDDKIHSRSRGPLQVLTRQPMEGRAREGGLRFGEMERDCIIAHGAALFLKERLLDNSDKFEVHVCNNCGLIAVANLNKQTYNCMRCKNAKVSQVIIPYATKLLFQELMSMCIAPRLVLAGPYDFR